MKKIPLDQALSSIVGPKRISSELSNRHFYAHDMMTGAILADKAQMPPYLPDWICWPETVEEIAEILKLANRRKVPVVPYGGGSGVSGGTIPLYGGILLDLRRRQSISPIEEKDGRYSVTAETGVYGQALEDHLNERGFTLGHFPSSIFCATLGGYLATRSAGQMSSKYGKIEDMTEDIETVAPQGQIIPMGGDVPAFPYVRPKDIFIGSEGCLGVITEARLRIFPLPPARRYRGVSFHRLDEGIESIRRILQSGLKPSVIRLYDPLDSLILRHGFEEEQNEQNSDSGVFGRLLQPMTRMAANPMKALKNNLFKLILENPRWVQQVLDRLPTEVILIMGFEGEEGFVKAQENMALRICQKFIAKDLGEEPGLHWLKNRYSISFKLPGIFEKNGFVDTIEVAATWDKLLNLYRTMRCAMAPEAVVGAHFSHAYPDGCSIYFTFLGRTGKPKKDRQIYETVWTEAMETCLASGGTISHHHGIGLLKVEYLPEELGALMDWYRQVKKTLDPNNILNPGKMGLPGRRDLEV